MAESILVTIKQLLGIPSEDTSFDSEIIVHINSAFMSINQLGVGPEIAFTIEDNTAKWSDFSIDINLYSGVKSYILLLVREIFDPPSNPAVLSSMQKLRSELEWRLIVQVPTL